LSALKQWFGYAGSWRLGHDQVVGQSCSGERNAHALQAVDSEKTLLPSVLTPKYQNVQPEGEAIHMQGSRRQPTSAGRKLGLALLGALLIPTVALLAALAAYDIALFLPHRQPFKEIVAKASAGDVLANPAFTRATQSVDGEDAVTLMVARRLLASTYPDRPPLAWQLELVLWRLLVAVHLSSTEIEALYRILAVPGGCNSLSMQMFGIPLGELDDEQLMKVAVVIRSPRRYMHRPDLINEQLRKLRDTAGSRRP